MDEGTPAISETALEDLARNYMSVQTVTRRLARYYDESILLCLPNIVALQPDILKDESASLEWGKGLLSALEEVSSSGVKYQVSVVGPDEDKHYAIKAVKLVHGLEHEFIFDYEFFSSPEYQIIAELSAKLHGLLSEKAYIKRGEKTHAVSQFSEVIEWLFEEAKKGQSIQRYKGLGEMNADQLWDTTMNPETRRMLQVRVEDAIAADEVFTTLMGDQVEPRREFIEKNALSAMNIDT